MNNFEISGLAKELLDISTQGIPVLIQRFSQEISMPVFITDSLFQLEWASAPPYEFEADPSLSIQRNDQAIGNSFICTVSTEVNQTVGLAAPILYKKNTLGFLFITNHAEAAAQLEEMESLLSYVAMLCAVQMQKKIDILHESYKYKEAFLFDLLYGNIKNQEDIIEQAKIWGWDLTLPYIAIVFSLKEFNHFSKDKLVLNVMLQIIENYLFQHNRKPLVIKRQNQVVVLFPLDKKEQENRELINDFITKIQKETKNLPTHPLVGSGIGKVYKNPTQLYRSFQEAKIAFELGILLNIEIPYFSDLGLERILYKHDLQDLKEFCSNILGDLESYDLQNSSNLMETLEAFTANHFDMTKTANAMFLHRNTLRYRLKKIEEILGFKLDDLNKRLDITAAFKIKLLRKI